MTDELDAMLADEPVAAPTLSGGATERKCYRHRWETVTTRVPAYDADGYQTLRAVEETVTRCSRCGVVKDEQRSRRGKQSRNYGNRAELKVAKKYGGTKIGHAGGPVDVRGTDFQTQVKTHRRLPPIEWRKSFAAMSAARERCPRMLLRFVQGPGLPPVDYFVFQADDFLDWFGRDGDEAA